MRHETAIPLLPVAMSLMAGIALGRWWQPDFPVLFVLVAAVALTAVCRRALPQSAGIDACFLLLGMTLMQMKGENDYDLWGHELEGVVMSEPIERQKNIGADLLIPSLGGHTLRCYIWKDERSKKIRLGDEIAVRLSKWQTAAKKGETKWNVRSFPSMYFVRYRNWHPGGTALSQLSVWQRSRLWFLGLRHRLLQRYRGFRTDADTYAVLAAMTLGDKSAQTSGLRETYAISGASHVLAISGLHVGIVYAMLTWLMLGRRRFWLSQVLTVSAIWAFALLTGLSPSVTRAATMISIYAVFAERGGRQSPANVLCFAAIVMLIADADTLFEVSFQLSFAAVFAILLFMPLLTAIYEPHGTVGRWTWDLTMVSLCAQAGVAPLTALYFGRLSVYFLLTNFLVIPATTIIIWGALLSLLFPPASVVLLWVVRTMNCGLRHIASLPGASIDSLHPTPLQVVLCYLLIGIGYILLRKISAYRLRF